MVYVSISTVVWHLVSICSVYYDRERGTEREKKKNKKMKETKQDGLFIDLFI